MPRPKFSLTPAGHQELQKEQKQLQSQREVAVRELSEARDMGDRSENAYYKTARAKLSGIDRRLRYLRHVLDGAQVVERSGSGRVELGAHVTVQLAAHQATYEIVSPQEADLARGKISFLSPLGKAIQGKRAGDKFAYQAPAGEITGKIIGVE